MAVIEKVKSGAWHIFTRTISVLCGLLVLGGIVWACYVVFVRSVTKPNPTTTQHAEQIENTDISPKPNFGGCVSFKVYQYYKEKKP